MRLYSAQYIVVRQFIQNSILFRLQQLHHYIYYIILIINNIDRIVEDKSVVDVVVVVVFWIETEKIKKSLKYTSKSTSKQTKSASKQTKFSSRFAESYIFTGRHPLINLSTIPIFMVK